MADDDLRSLVGLLDVGEPIVIVVRHELPAHAQRLLVALGCGWVVDPINGVRCSKQCRRRECRMSIDERRGPRNPREPGVITAGRIVTGGNGAPPWEPNLIDYRHSVVVAMKRADAGDETLEICPRCECEVDTMPAPHRPGCPGIGQRASSATSTSLITAANEERRQAAREQARADVEGLDLLERMDAGLPLGDIEEPEPGLEEAADERLGPDDAASSSSTVLGEVAAVADSSVSGAAPTPLDRGEPERAATSPSTANPYGLKKFGRGYIWTRDAAIAAVGDFNTVHGRAPQMEDSRKAVTGTLPSSKSASQLFDSWEAMVKAAGLEPVTRKIVSRRDAAKPADVASDGWIKVNGTGLRYRSAMDAYVAADEIEADGERVAKAARDDGNEGKADQAVDAARALAEKIRAAARAADGEPDTSGSTIDSSREGAADPGPEEGPRSPTPGIGERDDQPPQMRAPTAAATRTAPGGGGGSQPAPSPEADRLLISPSEMGGAARAYAVAAIAAARTFADTLERELEAADA